VSRRGRFQFSASQLRITRGALVLAALEIGLSLVALMSGKEAQASILKYLAATPSNVFEHGRVWTLVTSPFIEVDFIGLVMHAVVLWMFVPTLERFWGTKRFFRFAAITSIAGTLAGTLFGYLTGGEVAIMGLTPFVYASIVAFGITYAKQPVQFFGVLPLTGRQLMYGFIGFVALFVLLQGVWALGVAFAAAMIAAAVMCSKTMNPTLAYRRWKARRARAQLTVLQGGQKGGPCGAAPKKKPDGETWLN
jgi:membrane associated rhomboid family serine protease